MTTSIVALNPKPVPKTILKPPKSAPSSPKLLDKTVSLKKASESTLSSKRESVHGELGGIRRSSRRTARSAKPNQIPQSASSEPLQVSQSRTPRESAELERRFSNLELCQKNLVEQTRTRGELEYLAVSKNGFGRYWITVAGTGKPFMRESFASPEFCWECAVEIEENFEILQVIELRPGETMERIGEMVQKGLERERVSLSWG